MSYVLHITIYEIYEASNFSFCSVLYIGVVKSNNGGNDISLRCLLIYYRLLLQASMPASILTLNNSKQIVNDYWKL